MVYFSLVVYDTPDDDIERLVKSFRYVHLPYKLWVINNSLKKDYKSFFPTISDLVYVNNPVNEGFGRAHNITLKAAVEDRIDYVFVINPDVYFTEDVVSPVIDFLNYNEDVGMLMPEVLNPDGTVQHLPKLLPSPALVLLRKLKFLHSVYGESVKEYELRSAAKQTVFETPNISGCFTVIRTHILSDIGYYDTRFFLYFEDWDLSRRAFGKYRTVFYPFASIYHSGSKNKGVSIKKWTNRIVSYIKYFNKWGWNVNDEHSRINAKIINKSINSKSKTSRLSSYLKKIRYTAEY